MTSQAPKTPQQSSQQPSVQQSSSRISALWRFVKHVFGYYEQSAGSPATSLNKQSKAIDLSDPRLYCRVRSLERCYRQDTAVEATRKRLERYWEDAST